MRAGRKLSSPGGPDLDSLIAARNLSLQMLLHPLDMPSFMQNHWGRDAWIHSIRSSRFDALLTWQRLNTLIRDHQPSAPHFRLVKAGRSLPETAWHCTLSTLRGPLRQVDAERLMAELRGGASIVWDSIDRIDEPLRAIKQTFERSLESFVFVNLYASFGTVFGYGEHWDDHDVFVLQLAGRKRWRVCRPTRESPLPGEEAPLPSGRHTHDWTLRPGSVMYLPRGWWHQVTPLGEPSLHLTIGVLRPTNLDLLRWLIERTAAVDLFREDLPSGLTRKQSRTHAKALRQALEKWVTAEGIDAYRRVQAGAQPLDPRPTLQAVGAPDASTWDPTSDAQLLSTRAWLKVRDGKCIMSVAGSEWHAPLQSRQAIGALVAGERVQLGRLLETMSTELISELVIAGVLSLR
jgi:ribosomal protein L16 Arg81 hydroxylase